MRYIVKANGRVIAEFMRRWEAEKFIETNTKHNYYLEVREA